MAVRECCEKKRHGWLLMWKHHGFGLTVFLKRCLVEEGLKSKAKKLHVLNVDRTWGLLTAPLSEFANVCSWFIWMHSTCPFLTSITIIYIRKCFNRRIIKEVCLGAMTIYHELEFLWTLWFARGHHKWLGLSLGRVHDKQVGHVQSTRAKGKIAETQLKLEFRKAAFSLFGIPPWKSACRTALTFWPERTADLRPTTLSF